MAFVGWADLPSPPGLMAPRLCGSALPCPPHAFSYPVLYVESSLPSLHHPLTPTGQVPTCSSGLSWCHTVPSRRRHPLCFHSTVFFFFCHLCGDYYSYLYITQPSIIFYSSLYFELMVSKCNCVFLVPSIVLGTLKVPGRPWLHWLNCAVSC